MPKKSAPLRSNRMPIKSGPAPKKSGWKNDQQTGKSRQKVKLALLVIALIILLILSAQAVKLLRNFYKPLTPEITFDQRTLWDKRYPLNLILQNSSLALVYFDPNSNELSVIDLPEEYDDKNTTILGLKRLLESKLQIPIDGYIQVSSNFADLTPFEIVEKLKSNPLGWFLNLKSIKADLTPKEIMDLSFALPKVRFDKVKNYKLDSGQDVSTYLKDTKIVNDQATIAIFNATDVPGLAQKAASMIGNLGGNVIIVSNAGSQNLKKSYVWTKDNAPTYSAERLSLIFAPNCAKGVKCDILEDSDITNSRAQINIVLGQDFVEKY